MMESAPTVMNPALSGGPRSPQEVALSDAVKACQVSTLLLPFVGRIESEKFCVLFFVISATEHISIPFVRADKFVH